MNRSLECPECGAPTPPDAQQCSYCGAYLMTQRESRSGQAGAAPTRRRGWPRLAPGEGEFGWPGRAPVLVGLLIAAGLYLVGWLLEDLRYWLDGRAVTVWAVVLPGWLLLVSLAWRVERRGWLTGLGLAVLMLVFHLGSMWVISGRLNDDYVGISAAFAIASGAGWGLGRLLHYWMRWRRARKQDRQAERAGG